MKVSYTKNRRGDTVKFTIRDYSSETKGIGQKGEEIEIINNHFRFSFREPLKADPHPDLLALAVVAALLPFIKSPISFPKPVSSKFAKALKGAYDIDTANVDTKLKPRTRGVRTALAFSGGVDSVVCKEIMPEDTIKFTYVRMDHDEVEPRKDNFRQTTIDAVSQFEDVKLVDSDLEYIMSPYLQWATWVALSIPGFLIADDNEIGDIAYGLVAEGFYFRGMDKRSDAGFYDDTWQAVYHAAGLNMVLPTVGITEYGNLVIAKDMGLLDKTTPCPLGKLQKPCHKCAKCFRKDFASWSMGVMSRREFIDNLPTYMSAPNIRDYVMLSEPQGRYNFIEHQQVYMYSFRRWQWWPKPIRLFRKKVMLDKGLRDMSWVAKNDMRAFNRHNRGASSYEYMKNRLASVIENMSESDYTSLYRWHDLPNFYSRADARAKVARLDRQIERAIKRQKG